MANNFAFATDRPNMTNWNPDIGYYSEIDEGDYPFRMFSARYGSALIAYGTLFEKNLEYLCRGTRQGFKISLNEPGERARTTTRFYLLSPSEQMEILIKPQLIITSDELRSYTPNQRQCFFNSERRLQFFKFYTEINCEAECISNFTLQQCGCVKFTMPSIRHILDLLILKRKILHLAENVLKITYFVIFIRT